MHSLEAKSEIVSMTDMEKFCADDGRGARHYRAAFPTAWRNAETRFYRTRTARFSVMRLATRLPPSTFSSLSPVA
jgi:hypothetical protein